MSELIDALDQLQKEKDIEKEVIMQAIEDSLVAACNRDFGKNAIVNVNMDRETGDISVFVQKTVVEEVEDSSNQMTLADAKMRDENYELGDVVNIEVTPKNFGRIAAQHARSVIVQKIKEEERRVLFQHFSHKEKDIVTGVVQRYSGRNICISLDDKTDAVLTEKEQVKGEVFRPTDRIKLYIIEVKDTNKGPKILVSRTHPELVKRLFEKEVAEVFDGTVEIKSIAREAGSRTKIAVSSNDPNVDPVGACVGLNGARVNAIVNDLKGEKIDIITWSDDPAVLIENALSPSNVVSVRVNMADKSARVVVPDYQLSLAIGKEGQNARLAAKLTGFKIDIKSESQAAELQDDFLFDEVDAGEEPYPDTGTGEEAYVDAGSDEKDALYEEEAYDESGEYADETYDDTADYPEEEEYDDDTARVDETCDDTAEYADENYDEAYEENAEYAEGEYDEAYDENGEYADEYAEGEYDENYDGEYDEYAEGEYDEAYDENGEYADGEYDEAYDENGEYADGEYDEAYDENGEYAEGEYDETYDENGEYADENYDEAYDENGEYAEGEYDETYDENGEYAEGEYDEAYDEDGEYADEYDEGEYDENYDGEYDEYAEYADENYDEDGDENGAYDAEDDEAYDYDEEEP